MKKRVLVVDDTELNRDILEEILEEEDYDIITAEDGAKAIEIIKKEGDDISAILLDLMMPVVDGFGVLDFMEKENLLKHIPVIVITGDSSVENEKNCFKYGVVDLVRKPFNEDLVKLRTGNAIALYEAKNDLENTVRIQTEDLRNKNDILAKQAEKLKKSNQQIIDILGNVVESRNLESGQHIQRVKTYTKILANQVMKDYSEYGLDEHKVEVIVLASALHDVGKIAIPDSILLKPARLTAEEFEVMKGHTTRGCSILKNVHGVWDEEYAKVSYEICRHHHERYDGKGYPDKLEGDNIPISAQIVSVADVYDALVNERVYKDAFPKEKAFTMIITGECGTFSPKLLECFRKVRYEFEEVAG